MNTKHLLVTILLLFCLSEVSAKDVNLKKSDKQTCELIKYAMIDGPILSYWQLDGIAYMRDRCDSPGFSKFQMKRFCSAWKKENGDKRKECK